MIKKVFLTSIIITISLLLSISPTLQAAGMRTPTGSDEISASSISPEIRISSASSPEIYRYNPAVAYNATKNEFLVLWENSWPLPGKTDIYAQRIFSSGKQLSWFTVTTGSETRQNPAIAYNATNQEYLAVWSLIPSDNKWEVWGRIIAWNGAYLGNEFLIFKWANRSFVEPRVVWNSAHNEYLVITNAYDTQNAVWNDIVSRRVMADGSTPFSTSQVIQDPTVEPSEADIAYNPTTDEYLVVWRQNSGIGIDIVGARLRGDNGNLIAPPGIFLINQGSNQQNRPTVATNGKDRYLVAWEKFVGGSINSSIYIYGQELDQNGSLTGSMIDLAGDPDNIYSYYNPRIAIDGASNRILVIFTEVSPSGSNVNVHERHLSSPGDPGYYAIYPVANNVANVFPAITMGEPNSLMVYGKSTPAGSLIYGSLYSEQPYFFKPDSNLVPAVVYATNDGHIHELVLKGRWKDTDLTTVSGAPLLRTGAWQIRAFQRNDGVPMVIYLGVDFHIHALYMEIFRQNGQLKEVWKWADLSAITGSPTAATDPIGYVRSDGISTVVYGGSDGHIHELRLENGWIWADLTAIAGAPVGAYPVAYVRSDRISAIIYLSFTDSHLYELRLEDTWKLGDLTAISGAPNQDHGFFAYTRSDNISSVIFTGADNHIYEIWLDYTWWSADLSALSGAPETGKRPMGYVRSDLISTIVYSAAGHIYELRLDNGWQNYELTSVPNARLGEYPVGYVRADGINAVVYQGYDGHIQEIRLESGWQWADLTSMGGAPDSNIPPWPYNRRTIFNIYLPMTVQ